MRKLLFTLSVLLVVAALASACGGSGGASSGQGSTSGTTAGQSAGTATAGGSGVGEPTPATAETGGTGAGQATAAAPASGGAGGSAAAGDPKAGEALFTSATIGSNPGCKTCHTVDGTKLVGPSLNHIGTQAATLVPGESAEQYIRTSILDPNAYVVQGYTAGVMPSFKTVLSDTQLNDLVAYLLTLK